MRHLFSAAALASLIAVPAAAATTPSSFVKDAIKGDNSEIMLGQLAQARAGSSGVRQFGQTLVTDHTKAKEQMTQVAQSLHVTPPTEPMPKAQTEYKKLSKMNGAAFDKEFVRYMVKDHKKDIQKFQSEASANQGQASQMADQQLPTLKKHLSIAEQLKKEQTASQ